MHIEDRKTISTKHAALCLEASCPPFTYFRELAHFDFTFCKERQYERNPSDIKLYHELNRSLTLIPFPRSLLSSLLLSTGALPPPRHSLVNIISAALAVASAVPVLPASLTPAGDLDPDLPPSRRYCGGSFSVVMAGFR